MVQGCMHSTGDTGSIPGPGRCHMPAHHWNPRTQSLSSPTRGATTVRSLLSMTGESPGAATNTQHSQKKKKPIKLRLAHPCSQQYYSQQPKWSTCVEATEAYQWINTMRHLHAIQHYSALKRNAILTCAISLMNFEMMNYITDELCWVK